MQIYTYDTSKAKELGIRRSPEYDLIHRGWDGIDLQEPDKNGIIRFTAEVVKVDIFDLPQHINPVKE